MAQIKYKETQHLRQWDLMVLLGTLILVGVIALIQTLLNGQPNKNLLLLMSLSILVLSGLFYYINSMKLIARYNEKSIKLSTLPLGNIKRKIKWEDVAETEIVEMPKSSKWDEWNAVLSGLNNVTTKPGQTCLHLRMKNNEVINIGCADRKQLEQFVKDVKEYHPDLD